jgi:hypothetical protein
MENLEKEFSAYITLMSVMNEIELMNTPTIDIQVELTSALERISALIAKVKAKLDKSQDPEFKEILAEIRNELFETKGSLINSKGEILSLTEENKKLKEEIDDSKPKPYYLGGLYYMTKEGKGGTGPLCTGCYDKNKDFIRLTMSERVDQLTCPTCKTKYQRNSHNPCLSEDQSYEQTLKIAEQDQKEREERKKQNSN